MSRLFALGMIHIEGEKHDHAQCMACCWDRGLKLSVSFRRLRELKSLSLVFGSVSIVIPLSRVYRGVIVPPR